MSALLLMTSSVTSRWCLAVCVLLLALPMIVVDGGAVLQLQMITFNNEHNKNWDGSCCDPWCWSDCDHKFMFNLDLATG